MNSDILDFKDKFSGHCFIVGNGPSLLNTPMYKLHPSFGMNSIHLMYTKTDWRPDFYLNFQQGMLFNKNLIQRIGENIGYGMPSFLSVYFARYPQLIKDNVYFLNVARPRMRPLNLHDWMTNPYWIYSSATGAYNAAQLACYMGFDTIYFVGCDMGWKPFTQVDTNHFSIHYNEGLPGATNEKQAQDIDSRITLAHMAIKERCKENNVKVFNATIGGELEVYDRVDINEVA